MLPDSGMVPEYGSDNSSLRRAILPTSEGRANPLTSHGGWRGAAQVMPDENWSNGILNTSKLHKRWTEDGKSGCDAAGYRLSLTTGGFRLNGGLD